MTINLNGYEIAGDEAALMCQDDRKASWEAWKGHWEEVLARQKSAYLSIVDDIHARGVRSFIPNGYSIAQAVAARATQLSSIGMIVCDYDGESTQAGLHNLVSETYIMLIKAALCAPEELVGFGGSPEDEDVPAYVRAHGIHMLSCSMLGEPDWSDCPIDYSVYAVDADDPHGFLHHISEDMFKLGQIGIRAAQYERWEADGDGDDVGELYESTELGMSNRRPSKKERRLSDEAYADVHTAAAKAIMLSMAECERALGVDGKRSAEDDVLGAGELKALLDRVRSHLRWFFDYYHDERTRGGIPS